MSGGSVTLVTGGRPDGDALWNQVPMGNFIVFAWVDDQGVAWYNTVEGSDGHKNMLTSFEVGLLCACSL